MEALETLRAYIEQQLGAGHIASDVERDELCVFVKKEAIVDVMALLQDDPKCQFQCLVDMCGVDFPERSERFDVVYHLLSHTHNVRLRVKLATDEDTPVPSIVSIYPNAEWYEREVWDMYGVFFNDNPDLRRILTDYGFDGHPLRKDFPLTGYVEMRYDPEKKAVVYEPVNLPQAYRSFDYLSPWEGAQYVLPGDEKVSEEDAA